MKDIEAALDIPGHKNAIDYFDSEIYLVPSSVTHIGLGETVIQGTLIDRLYDAVHTDADIIIVPVSDGELNFIATNVDYLKFMPTLMLGIPDVSYSIVFRGNSGALPTTDYDDLRLAKDKAERKKSPSRQRNTNRNYSHSDAPDPAPSELTDSASVDEEDDV